MNVLIINAFLYILTAYTFKRKYGITPFVFLWIYYSIFAILGVLVVSSGTYFEAFSVSRSKELSLVPYVYNYFCMLIMTIPLSKVTLKQINIDKIKIPNGFKKHSKIVFIIFITLILCRFIELNMYSGMGYHERHKLITQDGAGYSLYSISWILGTIASLSLKIVNVLYPICVFLLLLFLLRNRIKISKFVLIASLLIAPYLIGYYITANRSGMFFIFLNLSFYYFLFKPYLSKSNKSKVYFIAVTLLCVLLSFSLGISSERFENSSVGVSGSIFRYFGEVFPNLGYQYWEEVQNYTLGARKFASYYSSFFDSGKVLQGFDATFDYWSFFTGVDTALFKTVFGDLYIEFGTIGTFVFVLIFATIVHKLVKKYPINVYNIPLYYYYYAICSNLILDLAQIYTSITFLYTVIGILILSFWLNRKKYFDC